MLREISGSRRGSIRSRVQKTSCKSYTAMGLRLILIPRTHLLEQLCSLGLSRRGRLSSRPAGCRARLP
jgi:hypothetical protein